MTNLEQFEQNLIAAYNALVRMANEDYPDSDETGVGRTIRSYTLPNVKLFIDGAQAGSVAHLRELASKKDA
jgi:hypothetical protein